MQLTLKEAATEFGISRQTIYRAEEAGKLKLLRQEIGRPGVFVRRGDVRRLVERKPSPRKTR